MFKQIVSARPAWAVLLCFLMSGPALAKPADLPSQPPIECQGVSIPSDPDEPAPPIDAALPAFVEQWLHHLGDVVRQPNRATNLGYLVPRLPVIRLWTAGGTAETPKAGSTAERDAHAERIFAAAELYRAIRLYGQAIPRYQRVHLLTPTSKLGQLAIDRIQELESLLRDASEESELVDPESIYHEMCMRSVPLGLVEVSY